MRFRAPPDTPTEEKKPEAMKSPQDGGEQKAHSTTPVRASEESDSDNSQRFPKQLTAPCYLPNPDDEGTMQPRRGSYHDPELTKEGSSTLGKWFAQKRMSSVAAASAASSMWRKASKKPEDLLTAEQVKAYHGILEGLSCIQGLHACVQHPCGNIYWDFKSERCLPGRVWQDTMPPEVREKVDRDFTPEEVQTIEDTIHLHSAPSNPDDIPPRAIFVIGPAAAGKSAVRHKTEDILQIKLEDYVEVDGDEFRKAHKGWIGVLNGDPTTGYRDALNILLPYTRKLKKRILSDAMSQRKNIILPSTGSNFEKLVKEVDSVRAQGYRVDVIGLVVSYTEARARALNRAHENGRWNDGTWEKWEAAMHAIKHFMDPSRSDWCIVFDNEDFTKPSTIYTRTHSAPFVESVMAEYRRRDLETLEEERREATESKMHRVEGIARAAGEEFMEIQKRLAAKSSGGK
eukprot:Sspe_Gene.56412::Locus_31034_Transcript_2_3_Confidence_0.333_Length_1554::g.56412::m.56412